MNMFHCISHATGTCFIVFHMPQEHVSLYFICHRNMFHCISYATGTCFSVFHMPQEHVSLYFICHRNMFQCISYATGTCFTVLHMPQEHVSLYFICHSNMFHCISYATGTFFTVFHMPQEHFSYPDVTIDNQEIEIVDDFKFQCILINEHIKWTSHTESIETVNHNIRKETSLAPLRSSDLIIW